jgi:hypothetical protein
MSSVHPAPTVWTPCQHRVDLRRRRRGRYNQKDKKSLNENLNLRKRGSGGETYARLFRAMKARNAVAPASLDRLVAYQRPLALEGKGHVVRRFFLSEPSSASRQARRHASTGNPQNFHGKRHALRHRDAHALAHCQKGKL